MQFKHDYMVCDLEVITSKNKYYKKAFNICDDSTNQYLDDEDPFNAYIKTLFKFDFPDSGVTNIESSQTITINGSNCKTKIVDMDSESVGIEQCTPNPAGA